MGRIPPCQTAALDVLDQLFFNQLLVYCALDDSEREWLQKIVEDVSFAVHETGATDLDAECMKHGVLCLLEVMLADSQERQEAAIGFSMVRSSSLTMDVVQELDAYTRDFFQAFLCVLWEKAHGDVMKPVVQIAMNLVDRFRTAPATVRYRLTERSLAMEFPMAPLNFVGWAANTKIISSAKYSPTKAADIRPEKLAARICLSCEFAMVRNYVGAQTNAPNLAGVALDHNVAPLLPDTIRTLLDQMHRFEERKRLPSLRNTVHMFRVGQEEDRNYVRAFFSTVGQVCTRYRIWTGTLASWLGAIGAAMVEIGSSSKQQSSKPIYNDFNNSGSITDDVVKLLSECGFTITGRTLYQRHRELSDKVFRQVRTYHHVLKVVGVAFSTHIDDIVLYSVISNTAGPELRGYSETV